MILVRFKTAFKFGLLLFSQIEGVRDNGDTVPDVLNELNSLCNRKLEYFRKVSIHNKPRSSPHPNSGKKNFLFNT